MRHATRGRRERRGCGVLERRQTHLSSRPTNGLHEHVARTYLMLNTYMLSAISHKGPDAVYMCVFLIRINYARTEQSRNLHDN